ncbi:N-acetylneuraminate lyase B isoform X2 [Lasioglossum baleicum]|uniref:N-acetylneuraminate lyase B isoform X2 n=1 Tax=Lasioglossum baleicum TaxID=434251 RepID=UPI003FCC9B4C
MSKPAFTFKGLMVPVFTPFNNDSQRTLNLAVIPQYAEYLAKKKVTGILVNGTTGEGTSMSVAERKSVAAAWANAVKTTKQHLMIQVGGVPLPDVLELAKHAESIKADSILCLPELYFKPTTVEQLTEYLKTVGKAAPNTPFFYYHIPMFTNINIHMGQFLESLGDKIPNFAGIKFTSSILDEGIQALYADNKKYTVFLGNDQLINAGCSEGMDSFIVTTINMFPEYSQEILTQWKGGNVLKAREMQAQLTKAVMAITKYGGWVETMKIAMPFLTNMEIGPVRSPLFTLPLEMRTSMAKDLQILGFQIKM